MCVIDCLLCFAAAVSVEMAGWYTRHLEEHCKGNMDALEEITTATAVKLFPRFQAVVYP
jgi:hypothetical protein